MRSSKTKKGFFARLSATPTTSRENSPAARRTRSSCPRVSGSKVPGYTAMTIARLLARPVADYSLSCTPQQMEENPPGAPGPDNFQAPGRHRRLIRPSTALDVDQPAGTSEAHRLRQRRRQQWGIERRIEKHQVE